DAGSDDSAAMDARQRTLVAEIVEVLADGLRRNLETPGEVFHHHPAEGAGDVENFSLAVGQSGHGGTLRQIGPHGAADPWSGQRCSAAAKPTDGRKPGLVKTPKRPPTPGGCSHHSTQPVASASAQTGRPWVLANCAIDMWSYGT